MSILKEKNLFLSLWIMSDRSRQPKLGDGTQTSIYPSMYKDNEVQIAFKYTTTRLNTAASTLDCIRKSPPAAIICVDGGISDPKYVNFQSRLAVYAQSGGTVIFAHLFSNFVSGSNMKRLWGSFGLDWQSGDYHRTDFALNPGCKDVFGSQRWNNLDKAYNVKALHLKGVPSEGKVYVPADGAKSMSMVFAPAEVDQDQTPAAFTHYGKGLVGYVGDVNNEGGSRKLVMEMLGEDYFTHLTFLC